MPTFTLTPEQAATADVSLRVAYDEHAAGHTGMVVGQIYEGDFAEGDGTVLCKFGFIPEDKADIVRKVMEGVPCPE